MMRKMPQVRAYMTPLPQTIAPKAPLGEARRLMREHQIRHLPVEDKDQLLGFVSDRMVREALADRDGAFLTVEEIMIREPFVVEASSNLDLIAAEMAEEKYGCALVKEQDELVGIFTTVDACRALRNLLQETVWLAD